MNKRISYTTEFLRDSSVFCDETYVGYHWHNSTESAMMSIGSKLWINLNFVI